MYNKLPNTNKMEWEKVKNLSLFFQFTGIENNLLHYLTLYYSIVKDSNADLGVIFRFLQNSPITKAVCTKFSKTFFCIFGNILTFLRENKEASFLIF